MDPRTGWPGGHPGSVFWLRHAFRPDWGRLPGVGRCPHLAVPRASAVRACDRGEAHGQGSESYRRSGMLEALEILDWCEADGIVAIGWLVAQMA